MRLIKLISLAIILNFTVLTFITVKGVSTFNSSQSITSCTSNCLTISAPGSLDRNISLNNLPSSVPLFVGQNKTNRIYFAMDPAIVEEVLLMEDYDTGANGAFKVDVTISDFVNNNNLNKKIGYENIKLISYSEEDTYAIEGNLRFNPTDPVTSLIEPSFVNRPGDIFDYNTYTRNSDIYSQLTNYVGVSTAYNPDHTRAGTSSPLTIIDGSIHSISKRYGIYRSRLGIAIDVPSNLIPQLIDGNYQSTLTFIISAI